MKEGNDFVIHRLIKIGVLALSLYILSYINLVFAGVIFNEPLIRIFNFLNHFLLLILILVIPMIMMFIPILLDFVFPIPRTTFLASCLDLIVMFVLFHLAFRLIHNLDILYIHIPFITLNPKVLSNDTVNINPSLWFIKIGLAFLYMGQLSVDLSRLIAYKDVNAD